MPSRPLRWWSVLATVALLSAAWPPSAIAHSTATVVVLVRHAEKATAPAGDPALSEAGTARAAALADALAGAHLTAVVTTEFRRTRDTAAPAAAAAHLTPIVVRGGDDTAAHARAVADEVRRHAGGTVLVVGHSNTVPAIVRALGGPDLPDLCDGEFATLFTVVVEEGRPARLVRGSYGPPDADRGACGGAMRQR